MKFSRSIFSLRRLKARGRDSEGFALSPILYLLGLIGVGAGVLFSGYSQILMSSQRMSNTLAVKNDLQGTATTLAATAWMSDDYSMLCPPLVGSSSPAVPSSHCTVVSNAVTVGTSFASAVAANLPGNYASVSSTGSPIEVGVFKTGAGPKVLDPWGHYYVYCRWENGIGSSPAIEIISAGANGRIETTCNTGTAGGDDQIVLWSTAVTQQRAAVWQTTNIGTSTTIGTASFGQTGHQVSIDAATGSLTIPSGGNAHIYGDLTVDGTSTLAATQLGNMTVNGTLHTTGATTLDSTLNVGAATILHTTLGVSGLSTLDSETVTNNANVGGTLGVTGASTLGSLSASSASVSGTGYFGGDLTTATSKIQIGTNMPVGSSSTPLLTVGKAVATVYPFTVDQNGSVTGNSFTGSFAGPLSGTLTGNQTGGSINATTIDASGAVHFHSTLTVDGGITGPVAVGSATGILPIANGGTSSNTGAGALTNLVTAAAGGVSNFIPGSYLQTGTVTSTQLNNTGVGAGTYNSVTVTADGRVVSGANTSTTVGSITDNAGQTVATGTSGITTTIGSTTQGLFTNTGLMIGSSRSPLNKLDVYGATAIGSGYAGLYTAPTNGLIVQGNVGIGTNNPLTYQLNVNGSINATSYTGDGSNLTGIGTSALTGVLPIVKGGTNASSQVTDGVAYFDGTRITSDSGFVYAASGNVGIGTAGPSAPLDIKSTTATNNMAFGVDGSNTTYNVVSLNGSLFQTGMIGLEGGGGSDKNLWVQTPAGGKIIFRPNGTPGTTGVAAINGTGIGLGTTTPQSALQAYNAEVQVGSSGNSCAALTSGAIRFNGTTLYYCDGTTWTALQSGSASVTLGVSAAATSPQRSGQAGTGLYTAGSGLVDFASSGSQVAEFSSSGLIVPTGSIGVGTTAAQSKIQAFGGEVQVGSSSSSCAALNAGAIRYSAGTLYFCNGTTWTASSSGATGANLTVGTSTITSGTSTRVIYDNAGVVGEYVISGTGSVAMTNSPTFVTPALGTPSSATLTNATGLPISTGVSGLGAGVATFLATPSSANLAAALTDETGTGNAVFSASPTFTGTISAANLTLSGTEAMTLGSDYTTTGAQNNVSLGTVSAVRYNGVGTATFTGIVAGSNLNGQILTLHNASSNTLTIANQSASSTAANRVITGTGADLPIPANTSVTMQYDGTASRWRVTGSSNAAQALAAGSDLQVQFNNSGNMAGDSNFNWDYTNHRLGIGTATPASILSVYASGVYSLVFDTNGLRVHTNFTGADINAGTAGVASDGTFYSTPGTNHIAFSMNGSGPNYGSIDSYNNHTWSLAYGANNGLSTFTPNTPVLVWNDSGNVGVGTATPQSKLHVQAGEVQVGSSSSSCDALHAGAIRYSAGTLYFCNGTTWTASSSGATGANLTVGTSTITSGTSTRVIYDNAGVVGEYVISGTGSVAMTTSPTFVTPVLGTPTSVTLTNATGLPLTTGVTGVLPVANGGTNASSAGITSFNNITGYSAIGATGSTASSLVFSSAPTFTGTVNGAAATFSGIVQGGNFSVGTATPQSLIQAYNGEVQVGSSSSSCAALNAGAIRYSAGTLYFCNGTTWTASSSGATGANLTVGTSTITSGTSTRVIYDNAGVVGEYVISGTGSVAMTNSPTFVTPALGTPSSGTLTNATGLPLTTGVTGVLPVANGGTNASSPSITAFNNITGYSAIGATGSTASSLVFSSAPTFTGTVNGANLALSGTEALTLGADYTTTGAQNDVSLGAVSSVRYAGAGTATFTGLVAGSNVNGQILYLHNASASTLTIANQNASSTAANRVITGTGGDMPVPTNTSVTLQYDGTAARWRVTGSSNAALALAAGSDKQVQYNNNGAMTGESNFNWDYTNHRLGIGTAAPQVLIQAYNGEVEVGSSGASCDALHAGAIRYSAGTLYFCNGTTWTASSSGATGANLTVGTSTITSGTSTRVIYDNAGVVGEYVISGTGSVAMTNSPTFVTPALGTPSSGTLTNATGLPLTTGVTGVLPVANGGTNASSAGITAFNNITGYSAIGATGSTASSLVFSSAPTFTGTVNGANLALSGTEALTLGADYTTTGAQNDVSLGAVSSVRYAGAGTATFTGLVAGSNVNGQILYLHNASASTLTIANQNASSTAANRVITGTGGDMPVPTNTSVTLQYDGTAARWRVTGSSNAALALAAGSDKQVQYNNNGAMTGESNFNWDYTNHRLGIGTAAPQVLIQAYNGEVEVGSSGASCDALHAGAIRYSAGTLYFCNGTTWTASSSGATGANLTVGTSTITSGTSTRVIYDNAGVVGEYVISGTGSVAMTTSPTFVTPVLGTPTSVTLTNATGLPLTTGVTGVLPVANGGTNASSAGITAFNNITGYSAIGATGSTASSLVFSSAPTFTGTVNGAAATFSGIVQGGNFSVGTATPQSLIQAYNGEVQVGSSSSSCAALNAGAIRYSAGTLYFCNGTTWTASSSGATGANLTVGTSTITSGTSTRVIYDNAGVVGEYVISGTGSVAMTNSPTFVTPALGTPSSGTLTNATGLPLTTGVTGVLPVANGGTNASSPSITAFNNITGYTASGATGTTSTNLVFSASPTMTGTAGVASMTHSGIDALTLGSDYTTTGAQNDVSLGAVSAVRYNGAGTATFTGIVAGLNTNGQILYIHNASASTLTIANQNVSSAAADRVITGTGGDLLVPTNTSVSLQYDGTASRWRVTGSSNAALALAAGSDKQVQYNNNGAMTGESNFNWDYTNHRLGIGTAAPQALIQAYNGEVEVGSSGSSCAALNNGAIRYSGTTLYYCTGTTWTALSSGSSTTTLGSSAAATSPQRSGQAGTGLYTAGSGLVDVASNGTRVAEIGSTGLNLTGAAETLQINSNNAVYQDPPNENVAIGPNGFPVSVAIGTAYYDTAVGADALDFNSTGYANTAVGAFVLYDTTTGFNNSGFGSNALFSNTTGDSNSAFGQGAMYLNTTGQSNVAAGTGALYDNSNGSNNVAVGFAALNAGTSGQNNTVLGANTASTLKTGNNDIVLGYGQDVSAASTSNFINIGGAIFATGASGSVSSPAGSVGIGTATIANKFDVNGAASIGYVNTAAPSNGLLVSGNVGVGTAAPQSKLHVQAGEVQVGSSSSSCAALNAGAIRYSAGTLYYCNGSAWTATGASGTTNLTVGTSTITSGTSTRVVYDNAGVIGEYVISGTGSVAMTNSPTFVTPALGTPSSATLTNATGLPLTTGVTGVLPIANGGTNASTASITSFNNITGYTASGATGTTSTNLVFSGSPNLTGTAIGTSVVWTGTEALTLGSDFTTVGSSNNASLGTASSVRYNGAGAATFTGVVAGSNMNGQILYIHNASANTLTIANQSASSTAANRVITGTGGDLLVPTNTSVSLQYDGTANRWRVTGSSNAALALAAGSDKQVQYNNSGSMAGETNFNWDYTNHRLGIGTAAPQVLIQAYNGEVEVGSSGSSCAALNNGAIRFSGTTLYYCTGTTWTALSSGSSTTILGASAAATSPQRSGEAGTGLYTAGSGLVDVASIGTQVAEFSNGALNIVGTNPAFKTNGVNAFWQDTTNSNVAVGNNYMSSSLSSGVQNIGVGIYALGSVTSGSGSVAVGVQALQSNTSGAANVGIGTYALLYNTSGSQNIAIGHGALFNSLTADGNVEIGDHASWLSTTGAYNVGIGKGAQTANTTGSSNVAVGYQALVNGTSANNNIAIGYGVASTVTTGSQNIVVGYQADVPSAATSNFLNIGNNIFGTGFSGTLGSPAGSVGIGTAAPQSKFHVQAGEVQVGSSGSSCAALNNGAVRFSGTTLYYCTGSTWTALAAAGVTNLTVGSSTISSGTTTKVLYDNAGTLGEYTITGTGNVAMSASPTFTGTVAGSAANFSGNIQGGTLSVGTATAQSLIQAYGGEVQVGSSGNSCAALNNGAIRFNGSTLYYCTGTTWTAIAAASGVANLTVGTSTISSGTTTRVLFDNGGALGEYVITGTGNVAMSASPTFTGTVNGANVSLTGNLTDTQSIGTTSTDGMLLTNTTAAASGVQQWSPRIHLTGQGWKTNASAASQAVDFIEENQTVQGATNPTGNLTWSSNVNGAGYNARMTLTSGGSLGLGTAAPQSVIQTYNGEVQVGSSGSSCAPLNAGAMRYSGGSLYYCNGTAWVTSNSGTVAASGSNGQMQYNNSGTLGGATGVTYATTGNNLLIQAQNTADVAMVTKASAGGGGNDNWNPSDKDSSVTLSNGNLTATSNGTAGWSSVRSTQYLTSGKYYAEFIMNGDTGSGGSNGSWAIGLMPSTGNVSFTVLGNSGNGVGYFPHSGLLYNNGASSTIQTGSNANTICLAVDIGNKKVWFRVNNGNWNNSGTDNPATNTGGADLSGWWPGGGAAIAWSSDYNATSVVANFGASGFVYTVPSGFTSFTGSTQTGDLAEYQDSSGVVLAKFDATGNLSTTGTLSVTGASTLTGAVTGSSTASWTGSNTAASFIPNSSTIPANGLYLPAANSIGFATNSSAALTISSSQKVGVGTAAPQSLIQAYNGEVQVGSSSASCAALNNGAIRFSGSTMYYCSGTTWTALASGVTSLTVGSSTITSGTSTRVIYDNAGVVGEYVISGTGSVAMTNSPTFVTPALGTPSSGTLTNATGLPLTTGVTGVLPVANGGTNASSPSITAFNNITGYTASGATGTTSTNLVFSASPTMTGTAGVASMTHSGIDALTLGSDYTTTGAQNDVSLGAVSAVRYNGAGTATFTGIVAGLNTNGQILYIHNASASTLTIANQNVSSAAADRVITGTGGDLLVPTNTSVSLQYDGTASRWRVTGSSNAALALAAGSDKQVQYNNNGAMTGESNFNWDYTNHRLGIGTAAPQALIQAYNGEVEVGSSGSSCAALNNGAIRYSGTTLYYCTGTTWTALAASGVTNLTVGSSTITSGTSTRVIYDNAGVIGEYTITGTGSVAMSASPTFTGTVAAGTTTHTLSIGTTSSDGVLITNTTVAASGAQQWSPRLHFSGQGWKTNASAASQAVDFIEENQTVQGAANPSGNLTWSSSVNGGGYSPYMTLTSAGSLGLGTSAPQSLIQAYNAEVQVGSSGSSCAALNAGAMRYSSGTLYYCNGTTWTASSAGAAAAGSNGQMQYNNSGSLGGAAAVTYASSGTNLLISSQNGTDVPLVVKGTSSGSSSFNPGDTTAGITLSNSNLTATYASGSNTLSRSTTSRSSGLYYMEYNITSMSGGNSGVGIALASATASGCGNSATACAEVFSAGGIWVNGSPSGSTLNSLTSGGTVGVAVDFTHNKIWFRLNNGSWDNNGSDNPATNTGGVSIAGIAGTLYGSTTLAGATTLTANFAGPFSYPAPSGFSAFGTGGQSGDLADYQNSSGANLASIDASGDIITTGTITATGAISGSSTATFTGAISGSSTATFTGTNTSASFIPTSSTIPTNGMYLSAANTLDFATNSAKSLELSSAGAGTFTGSATATTFIPTGASAPTNGMFLPAANSVGLATNSSERLRISSAGIVGVGITNATAKLQVGSSSADSGSAPTTIGTSAYYLGLGAQEYNNNSYRLIGLGYHSSASTYYPAYIGYQEISNLGQTDGELIFGTRNATTDTLPTERMRISLAGNIGIATATPQSLVHAYGGEVQVGSSSASCAALNNGAIRFSGSTLYYCTGTTWTALASGAASLTVGSTTVSSGTTTRVLYDNAGTLGEYVITGTGNVVMSAAPTMTGTATMASINMSSQLINTQSIGTTSTDGMQLANTTAAASGAQQWSPRIHVTGQGWKTNATAASQPVDFIIENQTVQGAAAPTGNLNWSSQVNGGGYSSLMTLTSGGSLGIGSTSPQSNLDVSGSNSGSVATFTNTNTSGKAVYGVATSGSGASTYGVYGSAATSSGTAYGVYGTSSSVGGYGLYGINTGNGYGTYGSGLSGGVIGVCTGTNCYGVQGTANNSGGVGVYGSSTAAWGGYFVGNTSYGAIVTNGGPVGFGNTTPTAGFELAIPVTASAAIAYGMRDTQTLTAGANNDALDVIYLNPTFSDNSKTGVTHNALIAMSGNVGIGTATPQSLVHVQGGEVQVGSSSASCAALNNGAIRFSGTTLYYCTGSTWTSLASGASATTLGASSASTSPQRSGEVNTGLYSAGSGLVDFASTGTQVAEFSSTGLNLTGAAEKLKINGNNAIWQNTSTQNTALGSTALSATATGIGTANTGVGYQALNANTSGFENTAIGMNALVVNTTGYTNVAVGESALSLNTSGAANTALGESALFSNTSGSYNTAVGQGALQADTTGAQNTAVGQYSMSILTTGSNNTTLGESAGQNITTGHENVIIGQSTGLTIGTGYNNIIIGQSQDVAASSTHDTINIGGAIFATGATGSVSAPAGSVGIGTVTPQATLDVNGFAKLRLNSSQPVACNGATQGSLALTHTARTCVCDATSTWSDMVSGTACSW